jgi:hypothetical protein
MKKQSVRVHTIVPPALARAIKENFSNTREALEFALAAMDYIELDPKPVLAKFTDAERLLVLDAATNTFAPLHVQAEKLFTRKDATAKAVEFLKVDPAKLISKLAALPRMEEISLRRWANKWRRAA